MTEERTTGRRITGNGFSGLLDRAISVVNPQAGLRRAAARNALRFLNSGYGNYGANVTKKSLRGWDYFGGSSKEDIEDNIDVLRRLPHGRRGLKWKAADGMNTAATRSDGLKTTVSANISASAYAQYVNGYNSKQSSSSGPATRQTPSYSGVR